MDVLHTLYHEFVGFFNVDGVVKLFRTGNYQSLLTWDGITAAIGPFIPFLLVIEIIRAAVYKRFKIEDYRVPFLIFVFNRFIGRFISLAMVALCIGFFSKYAIFTATNTWYWFIYGYIVWEFGHFLYHYWGHKVRLFWCLHSQHHTPETMNLSVTYAHFFLEGAYADVIRTTVCILLGVNPFMLGVIMFIDGTWGAFIHVGENVIKDARFGFIGRLILTPSHHRVHHARNPLYMDTNFCNLLNIWDRVFKTYEPERRDITIEYGISRKVNMKNFFDVYFGEFYYLFKDVVKAPGLKNKLLYIVMPPGWSHTGEHKTATIVKREYREQEAASQQTATIQPAYEQEKAIC
ncbi:sterol desaturase family protein [Deminuibacter soli]|uniref:Sterol desaturase family protein n=1 Tax=Deminuibacter soli TaxID=2291815 RepID=A0A3E1NIS2_9BACT|nr:sterol desaturase family protein [Deminuibacter soli]RFM27830.1 sterol desaturase family protein [Deminuibacter soli]